MPYTKGSQLVGTAGKIAGLTLGEHKLFAKLREDKVLISSGLNYNVPYTKYIEAGLFEVHGRYTTIRSEGDTFERFVRTTYVTPKGIAWLRQKYIAYARPAEPRNEVVFGQQQLKLQLT